MTTLTTRAGKGSPLTNDEMDANLNNLNTDKLEVGTPATNIANTPAGGISATTVQAAINELDNKKAPKNSPIFTGPVTSPQYYNVTATYGVLQVNGTDVIKFGPAVLEYNGNALPTAIASTAQAQAGVDNMAALTSLRLREALNASGAAPIYACRAWVNFNGTGTVAIRASGNVSSVTDNGTGDYTVNFTAPMQDANYAWAFGEAVPNSISIAARSAPTVSALRIGSYNTAVGSADSADVSVTVFR